MNGYLHDIKAISDLAHARGAYVYTDIIQCAGAVPIELMGVKGFGFYYVREDLQGSVARPTQHSGGVRFNYAPWVEHPEPGIGEIGFQPVTGPSRYEVSYPSYEDAVAAPSNESPIAAFVIRDPAKTQQRLRAAGVHVAMRFGNKMRIAPSVYNNQQDVDRLLNALS